MYCRKSFSLFFAFFQHGIGSLVNSIFASSIPLNITSYWSKKLPISNRVVIISEIRYCRIIFSPSNRTLTTKVISNGSWENLSVNTYLTSCWRRKWTASIITWTENFKPSYVWCEIKILFFAFLEKLPSRCSVE